MVRLNFFKGCFLLVISLCCLNVAHAQLVYHDASDFPVLGKVVQDTKYRYSRLPASLESKSRRALWDLGLNSAGLAIRFASNSTTVAVKWELLLNRTMNHMSPTAIKGLDLYCLLNGKWTFVNTARPTGQKNDATIITNMPPKEREYMLYLSLYDEVINLKIGIDSLSNIELPRVEMPVQRKPVVYYGTSITQGACASRAGMAHTNILSRWLNREFINLGFSGNGQLDIEIANLIAQVDAGMVILDFVPNATVEQMEEKMYKFYSIIRERHPKMPILFVEDPRFPYMRFDSMIAAEVDHKNNTVRQIFEKMKKKGEKNIYFLSSKNMLGKDNEATVDGIHFTDIGFMRYSELLYPIIKKLLH
ncbi:MAG: hydrolase [Bacteroidetes bacterium]|nr:hydrolase [Bacteroidota bacterium]